jgi:hypothetical protein
MRDNHTLADYQMNGLTWELGPGQGASRRVQPALPRRLNATFFSYYTIYNLMRNETWRGLLSS